MIYHDKISKAFVAVGVGATIYLFTSVSTILIIFPAFLLTTGLIMEWYLERRREHDETTSKRELKSVIYYALIGILGLLITGAVVNYIPIPTAITPLSFDALAYGALMGISEEPFFRGFITDGLLSYFGSSQARFGGFAFRNVYVALALSACIFAIFHFAVYKTSTNALIYVWVGGFILSWIAYKSKRISPCIIAHVCNNIWSMLRVV